MNVYAKSVEIRWSDLDPNFHLRHSVYYDWGAFCRISFLADNGITPAVMAQQNIGPVLLREECVFKKEVRLGDVMEVNLRLDKCSADFSRWPMKHEIWKNGSILCAIITAEGAWLDTQHRKLAVPGNLFTAAMNAAAKTDNFRLTSKEKSN